MKGDDVTVYRVRGWADSFENNRTKELKRLTWVPVPVKADGDGYTELVEHPNGPAHFGCWNALIKVAAKCDPRGTLLRDGARPHTPETVARMTHMPPGLMAEAWERFVTIGWLEPCEIPQVDAGIPQVAAPSRARVRTELNGTELKGQPPVAPRKSPPRAAAPASPETPADGSCAQGGAQEPRPGPAGRPMVPDRDIPLCPAYRVAAEAAGVPLALVGQVILDARGMDPERWLAWLLVTETDLKHRAADPEAEPIRSPAAWYRRLCASGEPPEWARAEAKGRLAAYRLKAPSLPALDALADCLKSAGYKRECPRCRRAYWTDEGHECAPVGAAQEGGK